MSTIVEDPVIARVKAALQQQYGARIERALLYGSRARGDARPDSDYDIAVFLTDLPSRRAEIKRLADIGYDILDDTGQLINALPFGPGALEERTLLMHEIRKDGQDIL